MGKKRANQPGYVRRIGKGGKPYWAKEDLPIMPKKDLQSEEPDISWTRIGAFDQGNMMTDLIRKGFYTAVKMDDGGGYELQFEESGSSYDEYDYLGKAEDEDQLKRLIEKHLENGQAETS